jgi:hypothetical protein
MCVGVCICTHTHAHAHDEIRQSISNVYIVPDTYRFPIDMSKLSLLIIINS